MPKRIPIHRPRPKPTESQRKAIVDRRRGTRTERGYTNAWIRYSKDRLKRNPWCVRCLLKGLYVSATETDHVRPPDGPEDPLFWDDTNHQSLCHPCHSSKTATEDRGFGNAPRGSMQGGRGGSKVQETQPEPRPQPLICGRDMSSGGGRNRSRGIK